MIATLGPTRCTSFQFLQINFILCFTHLAMPCRPEEEFAQGSDDSDADLRRTPRRKRVIQPEPSDAEETESEGESEAEQESEKGKGKLTRKRKVHDYVLVKSWDLSERSALGEEDVVGNL